MDDAVARFVRQIKASRGNSFTPEVIHSVLREAASLFGGPPAMVAGPNTAFRWRLPDGSGVEVRPSITTIDLVWFDWADIVERHEPHVFEEYFADNATPFKWVIQPPGAPEIELDHYGGTLEDWNGVLEVLEFVLEWLPGDMEVIPPEWRPDAVGYQWTLVPAAETARIEIVGIRGGLQVTVVGRDGRTRQERIPVRRGSGVPIARILAGVTPNGRVEDLRECHLVGFTEGITTAWHATPAGGEAPLEHPVDWEGVRELAMTVPSQRGRKPPRGHTALTTAFDAEHAAALIAKLALAPDRLAELTAMGAEIGGTKYHQTLTLPGIEWQGRVRGSGEVSLPLSNPQDHPSPREGGHHIGRVAAALQRDAEAVLTAGRWSTSGRIVQVLSLGGSEVVLDSGATKTAPTRSWMSFRIDARGGDPYYDWLW